MNSHQSAPDSGLMLLSDGRCPVQLRWAPDSDAPANRLLKAGEVRVAIGSLEVDDGALEIAAAAEAIHRGARGRGGDWRAIPAWGRGVVVESLDLHVPVGEVVEAAMRVGTFWIGQRHGLRFAPASDAPPMMAWAGQLPALELRGRTLDVIDEAVGAWRDSRHGDRTLGNGHEQADSSRSAIGR